MNKIVAFIDFTELSDKIIRQSIVLCKQTKAELALLHVLSKDNASVEQEAETKLNAFAQRVKDQGIPCTVMIGNGNFFQTAPILLVKADCELAIIGTHGIKGLYQNLFGSNIWKLVSNLPCSALVISQFTEVSEQGFNHAMLPIGPHAEFDKKVLFTSELIAKSGKASFFGIDKAGIEISKEMMERVHQGKALFKENGIPSDFVQYESRQYSVGFAKETLSYAKEHSYDLISILARISSENAHFGQLDKEAMLLNEYGIPVLCVR
ncbi:MAG: hypothetical protein GC180_03735 [Bacteroidetes bacterium]|nr:hypothetical protein [Bacteroidota bacterium]